MTDIYTYHASMEQIDSDIKDQILAQAKAIQTFQPGPADVERALAKSHLTDRDFYSLLSDAAEPYLEAMAAKAQKVRQQYFGKNVTIFSPLYLSNYCANACRYCGFGENASIQRIHLQEDDIRQEMAFLRDEHVEEVLLLTGEAPARSSIDYISDAVKIAKDYFRVIGLEIYPANSQDYHTLHASGADYITVFQETYQPDAYDFFHPRGNKRNILYRMDAQERALMGGMRGVGFGVLYGLADPILDAYLNGFHANLIQNKYPHAEIAVSLPRIRPAAGIDLDNFSLISEQKLFQIMLAFRLYLPYAAITISTRERQAFRDLAIQYSATKLSASVSVGVGERSQHKDQELDDEQFEIADGRSQKEIETDLQALGYTTVLTDYLYL